MEQIQEETILALLIDKPAEGIRILTAQYGGLVYSITWRRLQGCLRKEDIEECVSDIFFELYLQRQDRSVERFAKDFFADDRREAGN